MNTPLVLDLPGVALEVVQQIDSTNSELMRRARSGQLEPVLLLAQQQTGGRGRLGREWFSAPQVAGAGTGALTFSLGLPLAPRDWSGLSLAVGLSVAESLHPALRLKWPNDVWWQQRKLAGILIETAICGEQRFAVIGVGVNIGAPRATGLSTPAACLRELLPDIDAAQALRQLAAPLVRTIKAFESSGFAPFQAAFKQRDALAGLALSLSDGTFGTALGVDGAGALQLQTPQGLRKIVSAEVSVRPWVASTGTALSGHN